MSALPHLPLRRRLLAGVAVAACGAGVAVQAAGVVDGAERSALDRQFAARGAQEAPPGIVVVDLDDDSFTRLRESFPLPRRVHAAVIDELRRAGARAIAYDVQFTEASPSLEDDEALLMALSRRPGVVLATTGVDERGRTEVLGGGEALAFAEAVPAAAQFPNDPDGVIRRMVLDVRGLPSFAIASVRAAGMRPAAAPVDRPLIDFRGPPRTFRSVPFWRVARGRFDPAAVRGKIVVVGASASSLQDLHPTTTARAESMAGLEIQASAIDTVLRGFPLRDAPGWAGTALLLALALLPPLLAHVRSTRAGVLGAAAAAVVVVAASHVAFRSGTVLPVIAPLGTLLASTVGVAGVAGLMTAVQRQRLRDQFARFVPDAVVDQVVAADELPGGERDVTVMFSDLRSFTTFAERSEPTALIRVLNRYLGAMCDVITDEGGTVVSYMGDGIMAVFGAPVGMPDHPDRAVAAARRMLERLDELNAEGGDGWPATPLRMGIGIMSGPVYSGQVGSARRVEYSVIGDTVNTASRLEGMTKQTGFAINVAGTTRDRLSDPGGLSFIGCVPVRGREEPLDLWGLVPNAPQLPRVAVDPGHGDVPQAHAPAEEQPGPADAGGGRPSSPRDAALPPGA